MTRAKSAVKYVGLCGGACVMLCHCASAPTPKTCPTGHYEQEAEMGALSSDGEDCRNVTQSISVYNSKGQYTGTRTESTRICTPRLRPGKPTGRMKDVWVCGDRPRRADASGGLKPCTDRHNVYFECDTGETCSQHPNRPRTTNGGHDEELFCIPRDPLVSLKECKGGSGDCPAHQFCKTFKPNRKMCTWVMCETDKDCEPESSVAWCTATPWQHPPTATANTKKFCQRR